MSSPRYRAESSRSRHTRATTSKNDEPAKEVRHTSPPRPALPSTPQLMVASVHYSANAGGTARTFLSSAAASPAAAYVPSYIQWSHSVPASLLEGEMVAVVIGGRGATSSHNPLLHSGSQSNLGPDSVSISMWGAELNLVAAQHLDRTLAEHHHSQPRENNSKSRFLHRQHLVVRQIVLSEGVVSQEGITTNGKSPYRQRASAAHEELNCENEERRSKRKKKADPQTFDSYPTHSEDDNEDSYNGFQRKVVVAMRKELLWAPSRLAGANASSSFSTGMGAPHHSSVPVYTALYPIRLSDDLYEAKVQRVLAEAVAEGKQTVRAPCRVEMCRVPCGEKDDGSLSSSEAPAFVELSIEGMCFVPAHSTVQRHRQKKVAAGASGSHVHVPAAVWTIWSIARTDRFIMSSAQHRLGGGGDTCRAVTAASGALSLVDPSGTDFYIVDFSAAHQDPSSPLQCVHIFDPTSATRDLVHTIALPWHLDGLIVKKLEGEGLGKKSDKTLQGQESLPAQPNPTWQVLLPRINGYNGSLPKPFVVFSQRAQRVFTIHSCLVARHTLRHVLCVWRLHSPYQLVEFMILPNVPWSGGSYYSEEDAENEKDREDNSQDTDDDDDEVELKDGHRGWRTCGIRNESFVASVYSSKNEEKSRRFKMSRFLRRVPAPIVSVSLRSIGSIDEGDANTAAPPDHHAPSSPSGEYLFITFYSLQTLVYKVNLPMSMGAKGTVIVRPSVLSSADKLAAAAARVGLSNNNNAAADSNNHYRTDNSPSRRIKSEQIIIGRLDEIVGEEEAINSRDRTPTVLTASEVLTLLQVHNSSGEGGREREGRLLSSLALQDPPPTNEELDAIRQHTLHFTSQLEEEHLECSPTQSPKKNSLRRPFPCADTFTDQQRRAVIASYAPSALAWLLLMRGGSRGGGKGVGGEESEGKNNNNNNNKGQQQQPLLTVGKTNTAQEGGDSRRVAPAETLTSSAIKAILPPYHQQYHQPRKMPTTHNEAVESSPYHHQEQEHAQHQQHPYRLGPGGGGGVGGRAARISRGATDVPQPPFTNSTTPSDALVTTPRVRERESEGERRGSDKGPGGGGLFYVERAAVHRSVTSPADQLQSPSPSSSASYYASLSKPLSPLDHTRRYNQSEGNFVAQTPTAPEDLHNPSTMGTARGALVVKESATTRGALSRGIEEDIRGSLAFHDASRASLFPSLRVFGPDSFAAKAMDAMGKRSQLLLLRRYWSKYVLFAEEEARRANTGTTYRGESGKGICAGVSLQADKKESQHYNNDNPRSGAVDDTNTSRRGGAQAERGEGLSPRKRLVRGSLLGQPIARRGADYLWEGLMSARVLGHTTIKTGIEESIAENSPPTEKKKESKNGGLIVIPISLLFGNLFDLEPTHHDEDSYYVYDNDDSDEVLDNVDGDGGGNSMSQSPRRVHSSGTKINGRKRTNPAPLPQLLLPRLLRQRVLDHAPSEPLVSVLMGPEHFRACQALIEACRENDVSLWISAPADELGAYECVSAVSGRFGDDKVDEDESEEEREEYSENRGEEEEEGSEGVSSSSHDELSPEEKMRRLTRKKVQRRRASRDSDVDVGGISYASILRRMINEIEEPAYSAGSSADASSRQHPKVSKRTASPSSSSTVNRMGHTNKKDFKKKPLSVVTNICGLPSLRRGYRSERHTALLTRFYATVDNSYPSSEHEQGEDDGKTERESEERALAVAEAEKELVSGLRETIWIRPVVLREASSSNDRATDAERGSRHSCCSRDSELITPSLAHPSSVLVLMPSMYHVQCIRPVMDASRQYDYDCGGEGTSETNVDRKEGKEGTASSSSSSRVMVAVHSVLAPTLTCSDAYRTDLVDGLTAIVSGSVFKSKNTNGNNARDGGPFSALQARSYSGSGGRHRDPSSVERGDGIGIITRPSPASLRAAATVSVFDIVRRLFTESLPSAAMRGGRLVGRGALLPSASEKSKTTSAETLRRKKEANPLKAKEEEEEKKENIHIHVEEEVCPLPRVLPLRIVRECSFTGETFVDVMTLAKN